MRVKFAPKLRDLLPNAPNLHVGLVITSQPAQFLDVLFQTLDFGLPAHRGARCFTFLFSAHRGTASMACSPQICRTASTNSGDGLTRCCACKNATEPSGERNSKTTELGPGESANNCSRPSSVSSVSDCISNRSRNSEGAAPTVI